MTSEMETPSDIDILSILRGSRFAARKIVDGDLIDDVAQDVFITIWSRARQGKRSGRRMYRFAAIESVRRMFGDPRYNGKYGREVHAEAESALTIDPDLASSSLALWRLQKVWPTLTDQQRAGLVSVIVDGYGSAGDAAREFCVALPAISTARLRALQRIDNPSAFTRVATRRVA